MIVRDPSASRPPVLAFSTNLVVDPEGSGAAVLDRMALVTDEDTTVFDQGRLAVAVIEGGTEADVLALAGPSDTQTNITVTAETIVQYRSTPVGTLTVLTTQTNVLVVDLNANASLAAVQELVRVMTFQNSTLRGPSPERVIQFTPSDGQGGVSAPVDLAVELQPVNHAPVAVNDEAATTADVPIGILIPKLMGNDSDPDGWISPGRGAETSMPISTGGLTMRCC